MKKLTSRFSWTPSSRSSTSSSSFESPLSSQHTTPTKPRISIRPRNRVSVDACAFCKEPLVNTFDGEEVVEATCGHFFHFDCVSELTGSNDIGDHTFCCPGCNSTVTCQNPELENSFFRCQMFGDTLRESNLQDPADNFDFSLVDQHLDVEQTPVDKTPVDLITPIEQTGTRFWEDDIPDTPPPRRRPAGLVPQILTSRTASPASATRPLFGLSSPTSASTDNSLHDAQPVKVIMSPEKSPVNISSSNEVPCVINFRTADFEPLPITLSKEEQIIISINKYRIANCLVDLFESELPEVDFTKLDLANFGELVIFDKVASLTINAEVHQDCMFFLFEKFLIVTSGDITSVIHVWQKDKHQMSSIHMDESTPTLVCNFATIQHPDLCIEMSNKIMVLKWYDILQLHIANTHNLSHYVPLVQVSTNAWYIIPEEDLIPESIRKARRMICNGLDLPFSYLNHQISRPARIPVNVILALPLQMPSECESTPEEYIAKLKQIFTDMVASMKDSDHISVIFLNTNSDDPELGTYYGPASTAWSGWKTVMESLTTNSLGSNGGWSSGIDCLNRMARLSFKDVTVNEVIYVSSNLLTESDKCKGGPAGNLIRGICNQYHATFHSILLSDEYIYTAEQLLGHHHLLSTSPPGTYSNYIYQYYAVDPEDLREQILKIVAAFDDILVTKLSSTVEFPAHVKVKTLEQAEIAGTMHISLTNLVCGYDKSVMFTVELQDTSKTKVQLAHSEAHLLPIGTTCWNDLEVYVTDTYRVDDQPQPLQLMIGNQKMDVSIFSKFSAVDNAYYIRRKIEHTIMDSIRTLILEEDDFSSSNREQIRQGLKSLLNRVWELTRSCNETNTANFGRNFKDWAGKMFDKLEAVQAGYQLRNYQLNNLKSLQWYLELL